MYEKDIEGIGTRFDLSATVGDLADSLITRPATIGEGATLKDAAEAIIERDTTRKVYVVDENGLLKGTITLETLMRHVSYRLGARPPGVISFFRFISEIEKDNVVNFMAKPSPITPQTKIVEVVRRVVEDRLNDFPVIDDKGALLGELNTLSLLKVTKSVLWTKGEGG